VDLNQLAIEISKREGKKINLSIAQIKEVLGHLCDIVDEDYVKVVQNIRKAGKRRNRRRKRERKAKV